MDPFDKARRADATRRLAEHAVYCPKCHCTFIKYARSLLNAEIEYLCEKGQSLLKAIAEGSTNA